jgi:ATP-dependent helicase/DNAse subunit B
MAKVIRLILSPSREARWQRLEEEYNRLRRRYGVTGVLWLTASRQQVEQWRQRREESGQSQIQDVQGFADTLVRSHVGDFVEVGPGERRQWVWEAIQQCRSRLVYYSRVGEKRGFVERVAGTVAELEEVGITPQFWQESLAERVGGAGLALQELALLYEEYDRRRREATAMSQAQRQFQAADLWYQGQREPFAQVGGVIVTGYVELPRSTAMLLEALADSGVEVWGEAPLVQDGPGLYRHGWSSLAAERVEGIPLEADGPASQPAQLRWIEAAGALGEARLVARQLRQWLDQGISAERIVLAGRDVNGRLAELYEEVCQEYAVPLAVDRRLSLTRHPAVGFLLLTLNVAARHWRFRDVTALLRHSYFRPSWGENEELRYAAEAFLRHLGIPQGRRTLERAIRYWTERARQIQRERKQPAGATTTASDPARPEVHELISSHKIAEDREGEGEPLKYLLELSLRCHDFLQQLFQRYDAVGIGVKPAASEEEESDGSVASEEAVREGKAEEGKSETRVDLGLSTGGVLQRLRVFVQELGLRPEVLEAEESQVLELLWRNVENVLRHERVQSWAELTTVVERVATLVEYVPPRKESCAQVRLVEAEEAAGLDCDCLVLVNTGEGSWPRLNRGETLLTDGQRQRLREAGLPLETAEQRFASEQLLFATLTTAPRRELVLSYAAFDANGESLLPAAFVQQWRDQNAALPMTVLQQKMLLDGYWTQQPLSAAEQRVQYAYAWARGRKGDRQGYPAVTEEVIQVLERAQRLAEARWGRTDYTAYDGRLQHPAALRVIQQLFDDQYLFSPTALETYLYCPFRFFAQHVLGLQKLSDPTEEIEQTRRGLVLHEALARFHRELAAQGQDHELVQAPKGVSTASTPADSGRSDEITESRDDNPKTATAELTEAEQRWVQRLEELITEEVQRQLPRGHSRLVREVWQWEGVRLRRYARRYWRQWQRLMGRCRKMGLVPKPVAFEETFGVGERNCLVEVAGGTVRLGGRIDRVDQDLGGQGLWIIDYKTGRGYGYTAAQVERLERLQLPVYALAWEKLYPHSEAPPPVRGLIYWFVTGSGPKVIWPVGRSQSSGVDDSQSWEQLRKRTIERMHQVVTAIRHGYFPLAPRERQCTSFCPFATMCRISQSRGLKERRWELMLLPLTMTAGEPPLQTREEKRTGWE